MSEEVIKEEAVKPAEVEEEIVEEAPKRRRVVKPKHDCALCHLGIAHEVA